MKYSVDCTKRIYYYNVKVEAQSESEAKEKVLALIENGDIGEDYKDEYMCCEKIEL